MKSTALKSFCLLVALLALSLAATGCQDSGGPAQSGSASAPAAEKQAAKPEAPPAPPAADQSAPVPMDQDLAVLRFGPSGQVKKVSQIVAMFNQPMVALGDYNRVPEGALTTEPALKGDTLWLNQYTLAFVPEKPLTGSLDLTAKLDLSKLPALSGAKLDAPLEIALNLPETNVDNSYLVNDPPRDLDQALKPTWRVYFNQPLAIDSLKGKAEFVFGDQSVPAEISPMKSVRRNAAEDELSEGDGRSFNFSPAEALPQGTAYKLRLAAGAQSLAGPKAGPELILAESSTFGPFKAGLDNIDKALNPEYGLYLNFSNPVDLREIVPLINIDNGYDLGPLKAMYAKKLPEDKAAPQEGGEKTVGDQAAAENATAEDEEFEDMDYIQDYLYFGGYFKAETAYTLTIGGEAKDIFGQKLDKPVIARFKTGNYDQEIDLGQSFGLLESATEPKLKLLATNIKEVEVQGYALTAEQAVKFLAKAGFTPGYYYGDLKEGEEALAGLTPGKMVVPIPGGAKNGRTKAPLDLKKLFGENLAGRFFYVKSSWTPTDNEGRVLKPRRAFALVQTADIGLALKTGQASSLVWTTDLVKGESLAGVELELRGPDGKILWSGQSDENGLAKLPGAAEILKKVKTDEARMQTAVFVVARHNGQMALWSANWAEGLEIWRWNAHYDDPMYRRDGRRAAWLLNALPLYKPGETAKFKLIVRDDDGEEMADYAGESLDLEVTDARGEVAAKAVVKVGPFGTASHEIPIPPDAALGQWTVRYSPAGEDKMAHAGTFMVMTYRAPAFEIDLGPRPENPVAGGVIERKIKADYHFGAPVAGQAIEYRVMARRSSFSLPGNFSGYSVVNGYFPADEDEDSGFGYTEPSVTVASDSALLDAQGSLAFSFSLAPAPDQKPAPRSFHTYVTVTDVDQRRISSSDSILVHPADIYAGLKSENFVAEAGKPFTIKLIAADHQGRPVPGRELKATVYRRTWQNVRRKSAGTAYEYVSRMVDEKMSEHQLTSGEGPVDLTISPEKAGYFIVQAEVKDQAGRLNQASLSFYVSGHDPVGWKMSNDDGLTLIADRQNYQPGDTARIMVQSPFDTGEGLLTVERAGVRSASVFKIENQTPIVEVPLTEADSPNVYVSVLLTRGRIADRPDESGLDFGKPAIRLGYTELKVESKKDLLTVAVKPDQKEVGPGGEVEVEISVTDHQGRPFSQADVALAAADAAVIQLAGDRSYHPEFLFHLDQPLMVRTADNLISLIGRQNWGLKGGNPGGGGAMDAKAMAAQGGGMDVRRQFAALAWFEPHVKLDDQGRAKVKVKMPENLTTFKIYAVASGSGRVTGTGETSVLVSRDLLVRSALPGYAGVGDEFQAAMVVSNRGKKSGQATVSLSGENFAILGDSEKTVAVGPGESLEVPFKVKAGSAGEARFLFKVTMGNDKDAAEFAIPVSPANQLTTQASYERLDAGRDKEVALGLDKAGLDLDRGGLEVSISPSLAGTMTEPFDWLLAYPHGCVEQTISRGFGSLTWLSLKNRFQPDEDKEAKAARNVAETLKKLTEWNLGGGYNSWPNRHDWDHRSVYLSAYALDFILSAKEADIALPDQTLPARIGDFLKTALSAEYKGWPGWYSDRAISQSRLYALAMLSRAGENVAAYIEEAYKKRAELSLPELINLTRAINFQTQSKSKKAQVTELIALMEKHIHVTAGEVQFDEVSVPEIWSSSVRTSAQALIALCEARPEHDLIPSLVRWLAGETSGGHFGTTHNNALAVAAVAKYAQTLEPEDPNLEVRALLGDGLLAQGAFKSFSDAAITGRAALAELPEGPAAVIYQSSGRGLAWVALKIKSAPAEPDLSAATSGGFMLSRAFTVVDRDGKEHAGRDHFKRGDIVRVTVTMMAPADRHNLVLEDRVPAGLEPMNFQLADADLSLLPMVSGGGYQRYWYNHQETWPDKVAVYADYLPAGVYTYSYLARAVTVGSYLTPGPRAEEMYAPETFGRGPGQVLVVE